MNITFFSNTMNNKQFKRQIKELKRFVSSDIDIIFISVFGSYNYDLQTPTSDIDWKLVYIPTLDDMIKRTPESEIVKVNNGQLEVMSIIRFVNELKAFELPDLEVLFCKYQWINPEHEMLFNTIKDIALDAIVNNKRLYAEKVIDTVKKIYERFVINKLITYNPKKAYNIPRIHYLFNNLIENEVYDLIPSPEVKTRILSYKLGNVGKEQAILECCDIIQKMESSMHELSNNLLNRFDERVDMLVKDVIVQNAFKVHQPPQPEQGVNTETEDKSAMITIMPMIRRNKADMLFTFTLTLCLIPFTVFAYLLFKI